jgi:hypothetical protein
VVTQMHQQMQQQNSGVALTCTEPQYMPQCMMHQHPFSSTLTRPENKSRPSQPRRHSVTGVSTCRKEHGAVATACVHNRQLQGALLLPIVCKDDTSNERLPPALAAGLSWSSWYLSARILTTQLRTRWSSHVAVSGSLEACTCGTRSYVTAISSHSVCELCTPCGCTRSGLDLIVS